MRNPIVILGGMGPQASLRFHQLLIEKSGAHTSDGDGFPHIVHFSLPVADFIHDEHAKQAAIYTLQGLTRVIQELQPSQLTLACNTAHLLVKNVKLLQGAPFMSMLDDVAVALKNDGVRRIGLMASPVTIQTGLYRAVLRKKGIGLILPDEAQKSQLEVAIRATIAGRARVTEAKTLATIAQSLTARGAEAILLGCTELPLIFPFEKSPMPIYDCLDIYANAVIERYYLYNRSIR